jgi:hypothetical protein
MFPDFTVCRFLGFPASALSDLQSHSAPPDDQTKGGQAKRHSIRRWLGDWRIVLPFPPRFPSLIPAAVNFMAPVPGKPGTASVRRLEILPADIDTPLKVRISIRPACPDIPFESLI